MSRPADLTWTAGTWATNTNHPAGSDPWSAQPCKVVHPGPAGGFVPGQGAGAEYLNYLFNAVFGVQGVERTFQQDLLDYVGQLPALNFSDGILEDDVNKAMVYCVGQSLWVGCGNLDTVKYSNTFALRWDPYGNPSGGLSMYDLDVTDTGAIVVVATGILGTDDLYEYDGVSAWNARTWAVGVNALPNVRYEPISGLWCIVAYTGGSPIVYTSSNRATWVARTAPPEFPTGTAINLLAVNKTSGRIVWVCGGTTLEWATSDDGGVTWTYRNTHTYVGSEPNFPKSLTYDATTGSFTLCVSRDNGKTKVWRSDDEGVTFAAVGGMNVETNKMASLGNLLCAASVAGDIVFSSDNGATWKYGGMNVGDMNVYSGGGAFIAVHATGLCRTLRIGNEGAAVAALT